MEWKPKVHAQCLLRAMIKNQDIEEILPIAIYANKPAMYEQLKVSGMAITEESPFSKEIFNSIHQRKKSFKYMDEEYLILSMHLFDKMKEFKYKDMPVYFSFESRVPIYVCKKVRCDDLYHETEDVVAYVIDKKTGREVTFNAEYCYTCDRYYALDKVVYRYIDAGCRLGVLLYPGDEGDGSNFSHYDEQSLLAANGYSVSKQRNLSTCTRQTILANVIESGLMKRNRIIYHLQGLIDLRLAQYGKDFSDAISKWEADIAFITQYKSVDEREVAGEVID